MCYQPLSVPETNEGTDGQPGLGLVKYEPWWSIKKLEQARLHLCREPMTEQTVRTNPQTHSSREPVWKPEREQTQTTQLFSPETHPESWISRDFKASPAFQLLWYSSSSSPNHINIFTEQIRLYQNHIVWIYKKQNNSLASLTLVFAWEVVSN